MDKEKFSKRLKLLRKEADITQEELANYLKQFSSTPRADKSLVNKYEKGISYPRHGDTIIRLSEKFGVAVAYLTGDSDKRTGEDLSLCEIVPIVSNKAAEYFLEDESIIGMECVSKRDGVDFCMLAPDNSMIFSGIKKGCTVYARKTDEIPSGNVAIISVDGKSPVLMRCYVNTDMILLRPDDRGETLDVTLGREEPDRIRVFGRVIYYRCEV